MGKLTFALCRHLRNLVRIGPALSLNHAQRLRKSWRPYGLSCSGGTRLESMTISSNWAATHCLRLKSYLASAMLSRSGCHYAAFSRSRSEEHTSELQSHLNIVCRLLLEKKKT